MILMAMNHNNNRKCQWHRPLALLLTLLLAVFSCFATSGTVTSTSVFAKVYSTDQVAGVPLADRPIDKTPDIEAEYAAVATEDGRILWERGGTVEVPMASTTKIMTAVVALEHANLDKECLVTRGASQMQPTSARLRQGDVLTLHDLLVALLLPSGNDAAVAVAQNIASTEADFVAMMNQKAAELGMKQTHFLDSSGLKEENHYTTVEDYLVLARYAMRNPTFAAIVGTKQATLTINGRQETYVNTNQLYNMTDGVLGIKTGTNIDSGACLVACTKHNNTVYYTVLLGSTEVARYTDTMSLLNWAYQHYRPVQLVTPDTQVADLGLASWIDRSVPVAAAAPVTVNVFDYDGAITQEVELPTWIGGIDQGQRVGRIIWSQNNSVLATVDLVAKETVPAPNFWEGWQIRWSRFLGIFSGAQDHVGNQVHLSANFAMP